MVIRSDDRKSIAWPRIQKAFAQDPEFDAKKSAEHSVDLSEARYSVAAQIRTEYVDALSMFCVDRPEFAHGYLLRAEFIYANYGKPENYELVPAHIPQMAQYNRGQASTFAAWTELALRGRWDTELLRSGLKDLNDYLMAQNYDDTCASGAEDQDRLFTVLCQMALGDFNTANAWMDGYIKHRKLRKLREGFTELVGGIQAQLLQGPSVLVEPFKSYFDNNRLGNYKFAEAQSFWLCVPIAVAMERIDKDWQGPPVWDAVLEYLLY